MLEIYFDGVLLDPLNYMELTQKWVMFDKEFKLGMTPSREFSLTIPKSVFNENAENVVIKYMSNDYAHLIIDKYTFDENGSIPKVKLTLVDKMMKANFNYDASLLELPKTVKDILLDICDKMGVELGTTSFDNEDEEVNFYDNTIQAREYLSYISELAGGFARIENDGKLYIRYFNNENSQTIMSDLCEKIIVGQKHKVERVVFDNGLVKFQTSEDETLETLYLNQVNVYINTQEQFDKIVEKILGFEYYNLDTGSTYILPNTFCGDILKLSYDNKNYYTIQNTPTLKFLGVWQGSYVLNLDSASQNETKVVSNGIQIKGIKIRQNRDENILTIAVEDIKTQKNVTNSDLYNKITANTTLIEQTASQITQKVTEVQGELQGNIDGVSTELDDAKENLNSLIQENTTLIQQLATNIISTIKTTGGNNLLRNSVGLAGLDFWEATGNVSSNQDDYIEHNSLSGSKFVLNGVSSLKQNYFTQPGVVYGVSFKLRHLLNANSNPVYVRIHRTEEDYDEVLVGEDTTKEYLDFQEFNTYTYIARSNTPYIEIVNAGDDVLEISDLIISVGENQSWSGYFDEVYGKEHRLDKYGLKLTDLVTGDYAEQTVNSLQFVDDGNVVAELSRNQVKSNIGRFENEIHLKKLQWISLDDDNVIEYIE
jgi:hypothetical protein